MDYTFDDPACNLALDEVLLREAESGGFGKSLRFWESSTPFIVLGLTQSVQTEVEVDASDAFCVPIHRRCSAGGCVVQGSGCLNYSLVLSKKNFPEVTTIHGSYAYILGAVIAVLGIPELRKAGISDIALGERKVSGNAQRRHKNYILHHGTLLYAADLTRFSTFLKEPKDRPEYRGSRAHESFVTNLDVNRERLVHSVSKAFQVSKAENKVDAGLIEKTRSLADEKYRQDSWNFKK